VWGVPEATTLTETRWFARTTARTPREIRTLRGLGGVVATVNATITGLRVEDQALAFTVDIAGDPGGAVKAAMAIYDASGAERQRTELGVMAVGDSWNALLDLPVSSLEDGDYGAWVQVLTTSTVDEGVHTYVDEGISFLVARGRIYPSSEQATERAFTQPPTLSPLRLEGTWIVFDMTNNEAFDVEADHKFSIGLLNTHGLQEFQGSELLKAGATQQGHYLLPEGLADGQYLVAVTLKAAGSDYPLVEPAAIQVDGNIVTVIPLP
jgi:hypothetical protein